MERRSSGHKRQRQKHPLTLTTSAGWTKSHPETPLAMAMAKLTEVGSNTTFAAAALVAWTCGGRGGGGTAPAVGMILRLVLAVSIASPLAVLNSI